MSDKFLFNTSVIFIGSLAIRDVYARKIIIHNNNIIRTGVDGWVFYAYKW